MSHKTNQHRHNWLITAVNYSQLYVSFVYKALKRCSGVFFTYANVEASTTYCMLRWFVVWFLTWLLWSQGDALSSIRTTLLFFPLHSCLHKRTAAHSGKDRRLLRPWLYKRAKKVFYLVINAHLLQREESLLPSNDCNVYVVISVSHLSQILWTSQLSCLSTYLYLMHSLLFRRWGLHDTVHLQNISLCSHVHCSIPVSVPRNKNIM